MSINDPQFKDKKYIGDAVYLAWDGYGVMLSTKRGYTEHCIYLEPPLLEALHKYYTRMLEKQTSEPKANGS